MERVQKVTHVEHVLIRPDSYVGSVSQTGEQYWTIEEGRFVNTPRKYSPALLKIFDEVLVNAIDRNSTHPKEVKNIKATITDESFSISNDGPLGGIEIQKHEKEGIWNPELTFGHLLTSTNYNDDDQRVTGGRNGYGAKLANIYASKFEILIKDSVNKKVYTQTWENNMGTCHPAKVASYRGASNLVSITVFPDWKRFGMSNLDTDTRKIFEKRVYDAAMCTSCKVSLNDEVLHKMSTDAYMKMYTSAPCVTVNTDRWSVSVAPSTDGFQQVSFVNGICTTKGGSHVDHVVNIIASGIIEEMGKKAKLRPAQVKNTLFILVRSTLVNPSFSSQVKSECTSKVSEFGSRFEYPKTFIKNVLKTGIQDEVMALAKFKELRELKKTDGHQRQSRLTGIPKLDDANWAGTAKGYQTTLILTEGDSAKALAVAGLSVVGRDKYGVFPLRGKPRNVRDASVAQLLANEEFNSVKKIIGLQQGVKYTDLKQLRYGHLMIMADADNDGSHIKGLVLNMIHMWWPELIDLGFLVSMITPIIKATKSSQSKWFFTERSFREWSKNQSTSGWNVKYYKGLGTSTSVEAREYFKTIDRLTVRFDLDDKAHDSICLAFEKTKADARKHWLTLASEKDQSELEIPYGDIHELSATNFIHKDLVHFSLADLKRSIGHLMDGFKPSQRKAMFAAFKRNMTKDVKVAQFAAYTAEISAYHHGEVSLADTIVRLAQDYTGSNNINLLVPSGQFGTRLQGGKDASQTRYIFTRLTPDTRKIFDDRDDAILTYIEDDGKKVEPEFYAPTLPMVLVNGTEGIGTGFSSYVPPHNPDDIRNNIKRAFKGQPLEPMKPWFRGFKGHIRKDENSWVADGISNISGRSIVITELPPGVWTDSYKEYLETLIQKKVISDFKNSSTTDSVSFTVYDYQGENLIKDFKLRKTIHETNMHLFHPTHGIKKYTSSEEILVDYMEVRLKMYDDRKKHLVKHLTAKAIEYRDKARFIKMVSDGDIIIFKKKRAVLESELLSHFKKIDDSLDHLLNIKTYQYTEEAVADMESKAKNASLELSEVERTSIIDMWRADL